jgi:V/A-type H+/Na+-transporting ATPase subunit I
MILRMARLRILGPRDRLDRVIQLLQDEGVVHLADASPTGPLRPVELSGADVRRSRHLADLARDLTALAGRVGPLPPPPGPPITPPSGHEFATWARRSRRVLRELDRLDQERRALDETRAELTRFQAFVRAFRGLVPATTTARTHSYHLVLRGEDHETVPHLSAALEKVLGREFVLESTALPSGELAAILLVRLEDAPRVDRLLAQAGVGELPLPPGFEGQALADLQPELERRRQETDEALARLDARRAELIESERSEVGPARAAVEDRLLGLTAQTRAAASDRSFVLEGWVPAPQANRLRETIERRFDGAVATEIVDRQDWRGDEAPVVLRNPRLFRPFEMVTRMLPLPRYGTIDPTPFVAVFFPMFFGLIMGDIGYGLALVALALLLRHRSAPGTTVRAASEILGACAAFAIAFGIGFGELFGDLGRRWFGLHPLIFDREEALIPFLGLAVAIGVVHVTLGLGLGVVNAARGHPRQAVGRGVALLMVLVIVVALLAAFEVLPHRFFTPAVVVLLAAFPVLVIAEGIIAPIELLSTLSNILSYARIMALGTASVMMAVVANELAGSLGSVVVGVVFGLLFHLVNFALGIFAPAIHGLRLHYVEFFGKFYSPGGQRYHPLGHWRPNGSSAG